MMTLIEYFGRIDEQFILCRVTLELVDKTSIKLVVRVPATFEEVPEPQPIRDMPASFQMTEAPVLSRLVRLQAINAAQEMARRFAELPIEGE